MLYSVTQRARKAVKRSRTTKPLHTISNQKRQTVTKACQTRGTTHKGRTCPPFAGRQDMTHALISDLNHPELRKNRNVEMFLKRYEKVINEVIMQPEDFTVIKNIGTGRFGQVQLVQPKGSENLYAMKVIKKSFRDGDPEILMQERNIMVLTDSPWHVQLHSAFQDTNNLYFIMDYMPGGDMLQFFGNRQLPEPWARFYAAEVVLAVEALHSLGYVHCDIKPENLLLDRNGHLRLADFGVCAKMDLKGRVCSESIKGSLLYMAPELFERQYSCFGRELDWWAVGVFIYKIIVGSHPFISTTGNVEETIKNYKQFLNFPNDIKISRDAKNIICSFLTRRKSRLGHDGVRKIKSHPFFKNSLWTFDTIRESVAPVVPGIDSSEAREHQDMLDSCFASFEEETSNDSRNYEGKHLSFVGFTYHRKDELPTPSSNVDVPTKEKKKKDIKEMLKDVHQNLEQEWKAHETTKAAYIETAKVFEIMEKTVEELQNKLSAVKASNHQLKDRLQELEKQNFSLFRHLRQDPTQTEVDVSIHQEIEEFLAHQQKLICIYYRNHEFVPALFFLPKKCHFCAQLMWSPCRRSVILKCHKCHIRIHRDHIERNDDITEVCEELQTNGVKSLFFWLKNRLLELKKRSSRLCRRFRQNLTQSKQDVSS